MIKAVLFDLDGTLLPLDQEKFVRRYVPMLTAKMEPYGLEPKKLGETLWGSVFLAAKNDGSRTNEDLIWEYFADVFGKDVVKLKPLFEEFYATKFDEAKDIAGFQPLASEIVSWLKGKGIKVILATNPIFPKVATDLRIQWAGLDPKDFDDCTVYETSRFAKPNPEYYAELLRVHGLSADECIMIGNDVNEDILPTSKLGIRNYLVTDCLINRDNRDISGIPHGTFADMVGFLKALF
ncbi:MAG: HAD family hydrolase [Candidatus Methanomethylophilaceae archaeon]|nr:HAD family hydrolase [Candidatus Methanomethylophilaceae archaeon]